MRIVSAVIEGFRNLSEVALDMPASVGLIVGKNAQGKTNVLEALFAALHGSSFRLSSDRALIGVGRPWARVVVELVSDDAEAHRVQAVWSNEGGRWTRQIKDNGVVLRLQDLPGRFPAIIFSPEDIDLLRLSPQYRRRFLNELIGATVLEYHQAVTEYGQALRQRNQLLLAIKQNRATEEELDVWDEKLSSVGAAIVAYRKQFTHSLDATARHRYAKLFGGGALEVKYLPNLDEDYPRNYLERLRSARSLDIVRATTTKGVHRDDLGFWLSGQDVRLSASRGEFRSVVLVLKLAEGDLLAEHTHETPIYFLDDVLSELDEGRQVAVVRELASAQLWLTTSDQSVVELFEEPAVFVVEAGRLTKAEAWGGEIGHQL